MPGAALFVLGSWQERERSDGRRGEGETYVNDNAPAQRGSSRTPVHLVPQQRRADSDDVSIVVVDDEVEVILPIPRADPEDLRNHEAGAPAMIIVETIDVTH